MGLNSDYLLKSSLLYKKSLNTMILFQVRAAIVTAVYKHVIGVSSVELNKFNTGEVLNYMSTDTDRVVNFAPSLHAVWSLPFQLIVTIFLLYQQLGASSLSGEFKIGIL